jgi:DNA helicase-2/ATP-dependent DNA helicase PcrA
MLPVTDADIKYAEQILFKREGVFDSERIRFIKELNSCDLQAVPGSGKTTVLLAKLLIIERYLPFKDGRGIIVLSHTNNAVNEIRDKIGSHCPKLFSDPNFVGTIQSFVDRFLAFPFYVNTYNKQPIRIDDELYEEKARGYMKVWLKGYTTKEGNNAKNYLQANNNINALRLSKIGAEHLLTKNYLGKKIDPNKPKGRTKKYVNWSVNEKQRVYEWLYDYKKKLMKDGYLCFDDAYYLANEYFLKYPRIKNLIQKRFRFAFVDEMQDMNKSQHDLLEDLFWDGGVSETIFQRIGDKNQAIYTDQSEMVDVWTDRPLVLELNGSHRLSVQNASIVQSLALSPITVNGLGVHEDGTSINIKPHLFVYTDSSKHLVISEFAKTIKQLQAQGKLSITPKHPFKAVCWTTKQEPGKVRINDYHPPFSKDAQRLKINYPCLESYMLSYDKSIKGFYSVRKNILNGLVRVLRLEGIMADEGRPFSKRTFLSFLLEMHPQESIYLRKKMLHWCQEIFKGNTDTVTKQIRDYIPRILGIFNKEINESKGFIENPAPVEGVTVNQLSGNSNVTGYEGIPIEVTTVHAAKGQTHTATLYLESFYEKSAGGGNYESQRLANAIKGEPPPSDAHKFVKQSMKMAYVGFSRPTHLLGFAIHKDRFDENMADLSIESWEIVFL